MGLNITVYKPIKYNGGGDTANDCIETVEEFPELSIFSHLMFDQENTYYDIEGNLQSMGYDINNLDTVNNASFDDGEDLTPLISFIDKTNKYYDFISHYDGEFINNSYFQTLEELLNSPAYDKFLPYKDELIKDGWVEQYDFFATGSEKFYYNLNSAKEYMIKIATVNLLNPTTIVKLEKSLQMEEVGYQRKGANKKFYEDKIWGKECVVDLNTLNEHWKLYFSDTNPDYFKNNIIDNFVEGETFVMYH